jgi:carbonic anhydrase/acetyltransferase-like protein (isoleucine patch superfamily)
VVHCRSVAERSLIGTGAIVLDGCEIGRECVIAAGTVLPPQSIIPDGSVVMGVPGKIIRRTTDADLQLIDHVVTSYVELGRLHSAGKFPNFA